MALAVAALFAVAAGCTTSDDPESIREDKFAQALTEMNPNWFLYEIGENRGAPTIKVEVSEIVDFKSAKKAVEAIQKVDPEFRGYIDFLDTKTGTVVRKMEIIPVPSAPPAEPTQQDAAPATQ